MGGAGPGRSAMRYPATPMSQGLRDAMRAERERRRHHSGTDATPARKPAAPSPTSSSSEPLDARLVALGWARVESRSKPGRYYYFNATTQETRWEAPGGV